MKKKYLFIGFLIICLSNLMSVNSQTPGFNDTITINESFTYDTTISLSCYQSIYGIGVSGNIQFYSDTSLVRIIVADTTGLEYMVYETYPMIDTVWNFSFTQKCEETCFLDGFSLNSVNIQIVNAFIQITHIDIGTNTMSNAEMLQKQAKQAYENIKIEKLNAFINSKEMIWSAGQTNLSKLFYIDKIKAFGLSKNSFGFEYYNGGIFSIYGKEEYFSDPTYGFVEEFDWRKIHDANIPGTFYYDGDELGGGWMTNIKCQNGCWTEQNGWECIENPEDCEGEYLESEACFGFAVVAAAEALVNLYFNNHYNFDLSEQQTLSNPTTGSPLPCGGIASGNSTGQILDLLKNYGLVSEIDFRFRGKEISCDNMLTPTEIVQIDYGSVNITGEDIKKSLINYGPLVWTGGDPWASWHGIVLVGYGVVHEGDVFYNMPPISPTSQYIGRTYWIMKNSYGSFANQSQNGYYYFFFDGGPPIRVDKLLTPITALTLSEYDRNYYDIDNDGYYNWGIGEKNPIWPVFADEKDGNDNNAALGPIDEYGNITITGPYSTSFEKKLDGWLQCGTDADDFFIHEGPAITYPDFGPYSAQDGDYYIYMDGDHVTYPYHSVIIESPNINLNNYCEYLFSFWYHKCIYWGGDGSKLEVSISFDHGDTWQKYWGVYDNTFFTGCDWAEITLQIPRQVNKIRFESKTGVVPYRNNTAIDNVTIVPIESASPWIIDDLVEINNGYAVCDDIIIESGGILTLKDACTLYLQENKKIIVKPGGQLLVDGATITSTSDQLWQGIEVWGNPSLSQIPANQGWLVVTNGGTIENAEVAVRAGSADYTGKGGGIVLAENAVFLNNTVSAMFDPYTAYTNTSAFGSCTFNYTKTITSGFKFYFAKLDNVISIQFTNCNFTNNSDQDYVGAGIKSINSIFSVEGLCTEYSGTECNDWDPGLFENLEYGVYATASTTTRFADIRHTTFTDNSHGIYLGGMTLPRVTSNEFQLNRTAAQGGYGLYLDGSTQYWVEDNHFESSIAETPTGIGIYVNASGSLANEIYLNSFDYIEYAVTVLGYNRNSRTTTTGLQIRCNYYDNTLYDETIVHEGPFLPGSDGIASIQGNNTLIPVPTDMAGNIFYYNTTVSGDFDDLNNQSNHFYYYYSNDAGDYDVEPLDYTASTVQKVAKPISDWTYEDGCPSNLTTGGGGGTEESRAAMNEALTNIESTETVLAALVDGGDTESLKTEVETSTPPETAEIYNELMTGSPYLSETVVGTAIDKEEVLPNSMVRDVMVANPHTSTSLQLLDKLDNRTNPMPAWMKAQILAGRSIQSLKTELEGQLAGYQMAKCRAMNSLVRHFGQQPENPAITDSLIALYQSDNTVGSRYMQAWLYLYSSQYQQGHNIMASIPANFTLAEDELAEYQNMQWLYTMLKGLLESGNGLDSLSGAQILQLQEIDADETGFASVYARNILLAIDELEYQEPIILPNSMKSAEVEEAYHEVLNSKAPTMLEVYPNPSKDFIILAYQFDKETKGMIGIRDISGKPVQSIPFDGIQDQVTVTTRGWTAGVYVLSLVVNDKVIETTKFTLVK